MALEQVPKYRGTMMSFNSALTGTGVALGIFIGGAILNFINNPSIGYPTLMVMLGSLGITGALLVLFLTKDLSTNPPNKPTA